MARTKKLHLTIQLSIPESLISHTDSGSKAGSSTESLNGVKTINHLRVLFASPSQSDSEPLPTLASLLPPLSSKVVLVLPFHPSIDIPTPIDILLRHPRPRLFFLPLDANITLEQAFRGMSWVEYPVIQVMSHSEWEEKMRQGSVAVVPVKKEVEGRGEKRERVEVEEVGRGHVDGGVKRTKETQGGLMGLGSYDSDVSDADAGDDVNVDAEDGDEGFGETEMVVTEEDVRVLHALGAAAAADME
jgi:hypothetical protein